MGQLGINDYFHRNTPSYVPSINIIQISAGGYFSLLLNNNGNVLSFGENTVNYITFNKLKNGQLGLGNNSASTIPYTTIIPNTNNIIQISAGGHHSLLLDSFGNVFSFGWNRVNYI